MAEYNTGRYRYDGSRPFSIEEVPTRISDFYENRAEYTAMLAEYVQKMDNLQSMMYAHDRYGLLVIFQALDAAGKDGTIKHVLSGVNPVGVRIHSFKRPTELELSHDYLWRSNRVLPERGTITIFNRSYYEEVLVVKVWPEILTKYQHLPKELTQDVDKVFKHRYKDICHLEKYLHRNGIRVVKFFLHVSKEEQGERLIERIKDPSKNWKFEDQDVKERARWDDYMRAYEDCINQTATEEAPWYVIPADDKRNMRLMVGEILVEELEKMDMHYPEVTAERHAELQTFIEIIESQNRT